jgi:hypothetical protein
MRFVVTPKQVEKSATLGRVDRRHDALTVGD